MLDAALVCIARVGLGKTTLDDVAREAGCARATVYRCFPGKQNLFGAVLEREVTALGTRAIAAAAETDSLADAIVAVILTGADTFHSHAALALRRRARAGVPRPAARHSNAGARCSAARPC